MPAGRRLALIDLASTDATPMAGAELRDPPPPGSTGRLRIRVAWSHPVPLGSVTFRLRVHASADGSAPPVTVPIGEPGADRRMRAIFEQEGKVDLAVAGPLAELFRDQILDRGGRLELPQDQDAGVVSVPTGTVVAVVAISLAVIAAICIALGLAAFGAVLLFAMSKGYNIDDAGYKVAVGEGQSRQEHQMVFKIRQPGT